MFCFSLRAHLASHLTSLLIVQLVDRARLQEALAEMGKADEHSKGMGAIPDIIFPLALSKFVQILQTYFQF